MTAEKVSIEIDYGSRFRERVVERNNPDPLIGMKIRINGTYALGDETHAPKDSISTNLIVQLEATEQILSDEKAVIEYMNGPMWLVFEPHDEELVKVTGCTTIEGVRDPSKRLSVDTSAFVSKADWMSELIQTAEQLHDKIIELNQDLEDDETIQRLENEIADAKDRINEF